MAPVEDTTGTVGFVGLGNMGRPLATNIVDAGLKVIVTDALGAEGRTPPGAVAAPSVSALARRATVVVLSLPDGDAVRQVASELVDADGSTVRDIVDTSTIGPTSARLVREVLAERGITYVDAPVSGGVQGAKERRITAMFAGPDEAFERVEPVLRGMSDNVFRVGAEVGMGQAMKLLNNFLSATTLVATSEAIAFGAANGLEPAVMLEVLNVSSGRSGATDEKFPRHIVPGTYRSGFTNTLMAKDLRLYWAEDAARAARGRVGEAVHATWQEFVHDRPGVDFTLVDPFLRGDPAAGEDA
jgi:3-hydroxyisobutyrate dehydrogenase